MNVAVFTTRYVYREGKPILYVFHHDEDGAWEFIGSDKSVNETDYMIIALEEIIKLDPSVLELADLPLGWAAYRDRTDAPWNLYLME
ncbi:DUF2185 domain-containing protein [Chitinophaga lutea]|uniref:DUF2185 domain-containing protein n=2 Tax=Chitinophaga lutea TaxID=2488634 RepID=A0A3N4PQ58_9BACT|nr:DUF2185 domain-containing protein [Chitinophaga lutea]